MAANELPAWYTTDIAPERTSEWSGTSRQDVDASADALPQRRSMSRVDEAGIFRQVIESLACLAVAVIVFRAFLLEGYIISTGSMAPALLGYHKQVVCPDCSYEFAYGVAFDRPNMSPSQLATCPNCGQGAIDLTTVPRNDGDQLLVSKYAYLFDDPARWEVAVFLNPNNPNQAYVKRVAGLPGETIFVRDGDVYIDGKLQQKSMAQQRAMRIPVFNQNHQATYSNWIPRWITDAKWDSRDNAFTFVNGPGNRAQSRPSDPSAPSASRHLAAPSDVSWVKYYHWPRLSPHLIEGSVDTANPIRPGIITDHYGYNQSSRIPERYRINDLMLSTQLSFGPPSDRHQNGHDTPDKLLSVASNGEFVARLSCRTKQIVSLIDADTQTLKMWVVGPVAQNVNQALSGNRKADATVPLKEEWFQQELNFELSSFDRQASVAVNGVELAVLPLDDDIRDVPNGKWSGSPEDEVSKIIVTDHATGSGLYASERQPGQVVRQSVWSDRPNAGKSRQSNGKAHQGQLSGISLSPVAFGTRRGSVTVRSLTLFRDVYYTTENHRHATERPLTLGDDEFFFLGDNSPVSLDSRGWVDPVVPRRLLVGRPLIVHLPSHPGRIKIGSTVKYVRVPDFSKIRCIR